MECCADELLQNTLPTMFGELEKCQKSLEGYLEQKQKAFPRFYFVSNAKLLTILSQGSDPLAMNEYYENVFDAVQYVEHDKNDKTIIHNVHGDGGVGHEVIPFITPVKAVGNIEDWLTTLLRTMRLTMKDHARACAAGVLEVQSDLSRLRSLVDGSIAQFALLAVQIMWTYETQTALEQCRLKKSAMKENNLRQKQVLDEMSSWCLQDLGTVSPFRLSRVVPPAALLLLLLLKVSLSLTRARRNVETACRRSTGRRSKRLLPSTSTSATSPRSS